MSYNPETGGETCEETAIRLAKEKYQLLDDKAVLALELSEHKNKIAEIARLLTGLPLDINELALKLITLSDNSCLNARNIIFRIMWEAKEGLTDRELNAFMYAIDNLVFAALTPTKLNLTKATFKAVADQIVAAFPGLKQFYPDDNEYLLPDRITFEALMARSFAFRREYILNRYDCENSSRELQYFFNRFHINVFKARGNTPGGYHSWLITLLSDGDILTIEPQRELGWWDLVYNEAWKYEPDEVEG